MSNTELTNILNWRRLNATTTLSGQPTEDQLAEICGLGVTHIVNLGPHTNKGALDDEAGAVSALGMTYIYIPVDFENPTTKNYIEFCDAIKQLKGKSVHVHCIYNARVTAFFYRFTVDGNPDCTPDAHAIMDGIWRPGGVWAKFIGNDEAVDRPNQYFGYDY